jgi:predicted AlkP superfamily pyrophosphatase or phosphodiesterase
VTWLPIQQYIVSAADVGAQFPPAGNDYVDADAKGTKSVVKLLAERDPTAVFLYIGQVDETGHAHGFHPSVKPYIDAIERADKHVGEAVEAVRARPTFANEQWLVLVTSDHGGKGTGHGGGHNEPEILNSFMIVSGPAAERGKLAIQTYLVDVPCTALIYLGAELDPAWKLDGKAVGLTK